MYTVERLRTKLSPLEDKSFTEKVMPLMKDAELRPFLRKFKGKECVVLNLSDAWGLLFPGKTCTLHELTILGRTLQALLWERSYIGGNLVFTKTIEEVESDGF
jgi:hypothetical protein